MSEIVTISAKRYTFLNQIWFEFNKNKLAVIGMVFFNFDISGITFCKINHALQSLKNGPCVFNGGCPNRRQGIIGLARMTWGGIYYHGL